MAERLALGVDIGGTKVAAAVVDARGRAIAGERGPVDPSGTQAGLESIFAVVDRLLERQAGLRRELVGIGAGAPGGIDWRRGVLRGATNLAWRDLALTEALTARYGLPALFDNDVNVAAWGERCFGGVAAGAGAGTGGTGQVAPDNLVFITVGTGIGSGLIEAGRIVRGQRGAGEIGHIPLFEDGPRCRCGMVGCLEAVAAGPAFAAAGRRAAEAGAAPGLLTAAGGDASAVTAAEIVRAAQEGDPASQRLLDREGYYLAVAVMIAARMLDPQVVVLGGGVAEAGAPLFEALWRNLARLRPQGPDPRAFAIPTRLGAGAGAIGAAALILQPERGFLDAGLLATLPSAQPPTPVHRTE